jgi:streptomycin 6-kinase
MIDVPEAFVQTTVAREGERGAAWLGELPGIVAELVERWECVPDGPVGHGGVGLIVPVRWRGDEPAVLKVSFPHPGNDHEPDAFAAWDGRGAVRLYARDDARYAMLLERVRPETLAELADEDEIITVAGRLNRRLAIPAPAELPRLADRAAEWEEQLHDDAAELPHGMRPATIDAAVATVRELGAVQPELVVHGDLHGRNVLRAEREPWLAVDPKGYVGDPAYDGGTLLKSRAPALLGSSDLRGAIPRALDVFSDAAELDRERVRRWAQLHAVQAAFWGRRHGFRMARSGAFRTTIVELADALADLLTELG